MRRLLLFTVLMLFAAVPRQAAAYICEDTGARTDIARDEGAFVGRYESSQPTGRRVLRFRVERVLEGELGETVDVDFGGVGGHFEPGERVGLTLTARDGRWESSDCSIHDPDELTDAVAPLPRPLGHGRAAFAVTVVWGDASLALLDRKGRTLAYGFGGLPLVRRDPVEFPVGVLVCPGGRRIVQLGGEKLIVRRTRDLRAIRWIERGDTKRAHCLSDAIVRATPAGIFRGERQIWAGEWTGMTFHGRFAYVQRGEALSRVDLRSGRVRPVAMLGPVSDQMAVSPDGRRLAVLAHEFRDPPEQSRSTAIVVDLRDGRVHRRDLGVLFSRVAPTWVARDALAIGMADHGPLRHQQAPRTLLVDARLAPRGEIAGWSAWPAVGMGGALVGIVGHRLERGTRAGTSVMARLPGSRIDHLVRLPGVEIRAPRRMPGF